LQRHDIDTEPVAMLAQESVVAPVRWARPGGSGSLGTWSEVLIFQVASLIVAAWAVALASVVTPSGAA
jgi:hypothetical protein